MKEQYLAEIRNGYCKEGDWWNAKMMIDGGRYCKTKQEAELWIDRAVKQGQELATKRHVMGTPPMSIESAPNEKNLVIETRIRKRQVTEWEEVK